VKVPSIDRATVLRLAELAQLRIDETDVDGLVRDLESIVAYASELSDVDVDGVPPMQRPAADGAAWVRGDVPHPELPREGLLAEAPRTEESGFAVPAFVDEG